MIKNIVFDLGRVLVDFDPRAYIAAFGYTEETVDRLLSTVFGPDWYYHDRGDIRTIDELRAIEIEKHPDLKKEIGEVLDGDWVRIHTLKTATAEYLADLKRRGYRIYILSNLSVESYEFISKYPFFGLTDGGVFSYRERACKPEPAIYRALLDRYALAPEETLFFDDVAENIAGAEALGIRGVLFRDIEQAKREAEPLLG